jgi:protein pelota
LKIIETNLRQGFVKVVPDSQDDLWHLYNVIYKGDEAYAFTSRAIKSDTDVSRPKSGERVSAFMGVKVESVAWDKFLGKLRIHGIIIHAPEIIPKGARQFKPASYNCEAKLVKASFGPP